MHLPTAERARAARIRSRTLLIAKSLHYFGVLRINQSANLRNATRCLFASTDTRAIPDGLLSREEDSCVERELGPRQFNWFQQWYPVASLDALDATKPHAFTLLGQPLVLWRDGSSNWRAFKDACPHRRVPLSEGRIEKDGTLMCAYHGWRFDGSGACTALPFCRPDDPALRSPRSCAVSHPALERGGLLWVWAEAGPSAAAAAASKQPPLPPEVQDDGTPIPGARSIGWSHRDLPYGHKFFIENVVDPAHVPVSHHNIAGDRYKDPRPFHVELTRPVSKDGGFEMRIPDPILTSMAESTTEFVPPGYVRIKQVNKNGSHTILALFSTPLKPGWTRLVGTQIMLEGPASRGRAGSVVGFVGTSLPQWLGHVFAPLFLNQDTVFLHRQERLVSRQLEELGQKRQQQQEQQEQQEQGTQAAAVTTTPATAMNGVVWSQPTYFTPGQADRGVRAWIDWLARFGGGDVSYAPGTPSLLSSPELDRSVLFDTWNTHTRHCTICLTALKRLQLSRAVAAVVGLSAVGLAFGSVVAKAAAAAASAAATVAAAAGSAPPFVASSANSGDAVASVLRQAAVWLLTSREGLVMLGVVTVVAVGVVLVTTKLEEMMHQVEHSHADNH